MLKAEGIEPASVSILAVGGGTTIWSAIQSGAVDAAILWPPFFAMAEKDGMRRLKYLGDVISYPTSGVSTSDRILRDQPTLVRRFLRATAKGLIYFQENRNRSENIALIGKLFKIDSEMAVKNYDFLRSIQTKDGIPSQQSLKTHVQVVKDAVRKLADEPEEKLMKQAYDFVPLRELSPGRK